MVQRQCQSNNAAETEAIAAELAAALAPGDVVLVEGELGRGQDDVRPGRRRALGVDRSVTSPTFTIGQRYPATVPVSHLDLYPRRRPRQRGSGPAGRLHRPRPDRVRRVAGGAVATIAGLARLAARVTSSSTPGRTSSVVTIERAVRILAFDTATRATTVALSGVGDVVYTARDDPPAGDAPRHATRLLPLICDGARAGGDRLGRGRSDRGRRRPRNVHGAADRDRHRAGARAGARHPVGRSLDAAVARARRRPGAEALPSGSTWSLAVLDARRGEVFAAGWRIDEAEEFEAALLLRVAIAPEALAELVAPLGPTRAGDRRRGGSIQGGSRALGSLHPRDDSQLHRVTATHHCRLAGGLQATVPDDVRPDYLRAPDAEMARRQRTSR